MQLHNDTKTSLSVYVNQGPIRLYGDLNLYSPRGIIKDMMEHNESEYVEPLGKIQSGVLEIENQLGAIKYEFNRVVKLILTGDDIGDEETPLGDTTEHSSEPSTKLEKVCHRWESTIG